MFVGGPRDGDREERPGRVDDAVVVVTMPVPRLLRIGSVENDMNPLAYAPRTFTYKRLPALSNFTAQVEVYGPDDWGVKRVVERLLEHYRPEQDEQP